MRHYALALLALTILSGLTHAQEAKDSPAQWEKAIAKFEAEDREHPVAPGGILFLGSSSIRKWELEKWFPGGTYSTAALVAPRSPIPSIISTAWFSPTSHPR